MYGNPLSKLAKALSSKYPVPPEPETGASANATSRFYTAELIQYPEAPLQPAFQIIFPAGIDEVEVGDIINLRNNIDEGIPTTHPFNEGSNVIAIWIYTNTTFNSWHMPSAMFSQLINATEDGPYLATWKYLVSAVTRELNRENHPWPPLYTYTDIQESMISSAGRDLIGNFTLIDFQGFGVATMFEEILPVLMQVMEAPAVLTGTSETPPETWQDGDIYIQHEE